MCLPLKPSFVWTQTMAMITQAVDREPYSSEEVPDGTSLRRLLLRELSLKYGDGDHDKQSFSAQSYVKRR